MFDTVRTIFFESGGGWVGDTVKIYALPGGSVPERKTDGAIGFDVRLRAIVSPTELTDGEPKLRKTLFDFEHMPEEPGIAMHVIKKPDGSLAFNLGPHESVLVGIGFVTEMQFPYFYWVAPRSGLAAKHGITVTNAPGTVDPDYRGEAGVLVYNRNSWGFELEHGMRIAQVVFQRAWIPELIQVSDFAELEETRRDAGGFGSTGLK